MRKKLQILLREGASELGLELDEGKEKAFEVYLKEIKKENKKVNLTSLTDNREIIIKHFLDSLSCAKACDFGVKLKVVDIGTGAGFPGLPLKIAYPEIELTLLDSSKKKTSFLSKTIECLNLKGISVVCCRAEDYGINSNNRGAFDLVLARAVAPLSVLVEYALPLLKLGGLFIAQKSRGLDKEIGEGRMAAKAVGGQIEEVREVKVPFLEAKRYLVLVKKISPSPKKYPRRPGIPAKRPLGKEFFVETKERKREE